MKIFLSSFLFLTALFLLFAAEAQSSLTASSNSIAGEAKNLLSTTVSNRRENKVVAITGVRFAYPLVQKWIDNYNAVNPDVQIIIEYRGSHDPANYDILIEAYEPDAEAKKDRNYVYIGRYAILPIANSQSAFSKTYSVKGLNQTLIKQLFFNDIFSDKKESIAVKEPYTVYTRLQKAGAPVTFSKLFGYLQKDIKGKSIAGSDEHLLKAVLRDSIGLSYLPLNLLFDQKTGKPLEGITILPVDLNGNGKVSDDEKIYSALSAIIQRLEAKSQTEVANVPMEYLNFSINKNDPSPEAIAFLQWILEHGHNDLHAFGFLKPEQARLEREKQNELSMKGKI